MEDRGISKNESVHRQFHLDETSFFSFFIRLVSSHHACSLPLHRDITIPGFVLGQTLLKLTINSKKKIHRVKDYYLLSLLDNISNRKINYMHVKLAV